MRILQRKWAVIQYYVKESGGDSEFYVVLCFHITRLISEEGGKKARFSKQHSGITSSYQFSISPLDGFHTSL
jgi:hypothetical protein